MAFFSRDATADILDPSQAKPITVVFMPPQPTRVETRMLIFSNDPDEPEFVVRLLGADASGPRGRYELSTETLDFGSHRPGQTDMRTFEIRNLGPTNPCLVTEVQLSTDSAPPFELTDGEQTQQSHLIKAHTALAIQIRYAPQDLGEHRGMVRFSISNPDRPSGEVELIARSALD